MNLRKIVIVLSFAVIALTIWNIRLADRVTVMEMHEQKSQKLRQELDGIKTAVGMLLLEASNSRLPPSPWEPVQATGAPNAKEGRDSPFSWCPQEQDGGEEWLIVGFPDSTEGISKIRLIESGSAGALIRIESVPEDQTTPETLWEGSPKTLSKNQIHEQTIALTRAATGNRLRLIFDTGAVPGWNQVDAVGVLAGDADEKIVWAVTAEASSHWTRPTTEPVSPETLQRADSPAH